MKTIKAEFEYKDGKLNFNCTTKNVDFNELKIAFIAIKEEIDRQILNEQKCPFFKENIRYAYSEKTSYNYQTKQNMKPKKLIRREVVNLLKPGEFETITDLAELNKLYALKIREELEEIQAADHKDINEFADLVQVSIDFALANGYTLDQLDSAGAKKFDEKGGFSNIALNNLNPSNPSNKLYFNGTPGY